MYTSARNLKYPSAFRLPLVFSIAGLLILLVMDRPALAAENTINPPAETKPNILLIVADYMGYADITPYGATDIATPNLQDIANQGVKFTHHYTAAPMCVPARASLLSGLKPINALSGLNWGRGNGLKAKDSHLVKTLKAADYKTAAIGKWHLGSEKGFHPNDHGFDYFYGFDSWTLGYHTHKTSDGEPGLYRNKTLIDEPGYLTELFSQEASAFIDRNADDPMFIYLSFNSGLPPYQRPDLPKAQWHTGWDAHKATRADYAKMVESMDQGIGQVLGALKKHKLADNTIVIFTYDHGGRNLVDSGPLFHGFSTLWEGGIRVPLIMHWPSKLPKNHTVETPSIAMDLTASLLHAANSKAKTQLDGQSLFNKNFSLGDEKNREQRPLKWYWGNMKAIRQEQWKYLEDNHSQFLFDVVKDPGERNNLFSQHPDIVNTLKSQL